MKIVTRMNSEHRLIAVISLLGLSLLFAGCNSTGHHERKGAVAGAATGAVLGAIIGKQSNEEGEGAAVGAVAGALIGREMGRAKDRADYDVGRARSAEVYDATRVDYGAMMTEAEKDSVRARAGKERIDDWGYYLTSDEKRRLIDRAEQGVGL